MRFIIYPYVGPVAQAEDENPPKKKEPSSEEIVLKNRKVGFGHNSSRECAKEENVLGQTKPRS